MEHVEDGAESIGAMLSDIAESLREVSRKLDLVAARVDLPLPVPIPGDDRDVATRLATIEAWAFRTDRDVADLGRRLDTLQSVADAPGTGRRHAPEPGARREAESDAAPSGGRRAAEDGAGFRALPEPRRRDEGAGHRADEAGSRRAAGDAGPNSRRRADDPDTDALGQQAADAEPPSSGRRAATGGEAGASTGLPTRLSRRAAEESGQHSGAAGSVEESQDSAPPRRRAEYDPAAVGPVPARDGRSTSGDEGGLGRRAADDGGLGRRAIDESDAGRRGTEDGGAAAEYRTSNGQAPVSGRRAAEANGRVEVSSDPASADGRAAEANGTGPHAESGPPRRRAAERDAVEPAPGSEDATSAPSRRAAGDTGTERPASAYGPAGCGSQPGANPEAPGETAAPRVPRPRYAAGSSRQRIAEARAESAGRVAADQGEGGAPAHLSPAPGAQPAPAHLSADTGAQPTPAHLSTDPAAQPDSTHLAADPGLRPAPVRRRADPAETAVSPRLSADPGKLPAPRRPAETSDARLPAPDPEPAAEDEPAGPGLRAAVEARRASGRLPQRGAAPSPAPPGGTASQAPAAPEHTELTRPDEADRWSGPRRNGSSLGLGETVAAAYDQGLRDGFTGQQDGYRQPPATGYPLAESGEDFAPFADRQTPDAQTEQVGRGLTSGALERPGAGNGGSPQPGYADPGYGDFGAGITTGATAEETAHADKVQAMLDELKRTAAAMPFGPPTGEQDRR